MSFYALVDLINKGPPPVWKPGEVTREEFAQEVNRIHNSYRKMHHAYPLRLNEDLCTNAQAWADKLSKCQDLSRSEFRYRGNRVAQNISMKGSHHSKQGYTPQEICDQWYDEKRCFEFGVEPQQLTAGHFTNMVWRNSTEIGVGRAFGSDGRCVVVTFYFPPGNVIGQFSSNVFPLGAGSTRQSGQSGNFG